MSYPNDQGQAAGAIPVWQALALQNPLSGALISFATSGDNNIVAGVTAKVIKAYRLYIVVGGATNITIKDGSTALTGAMPFASNGSLVLDFSGIPWYTTSAGNALVINSSAAVQVSGRVEYTQA